MSLMNLQKLRRICRVDSSHNLASMTIDLPPDDPLNHVKFRSANEPHYALIDRIDCFGSYHLTQLWIRYRTADPAMTGTIPTLRRFNIGLTLAFKPRLREILTEHGFHSRYLPDTIGAGFDDYSTVFTAPYKVPHEFTTQIHHASYNSGASLRAALKYQARINQS